MIRVGILGLGNIATRLITQQKKYQIQVFDRKTERTESISKKYGCGLSKTLEDFIEKTDVIILAIRPENLQNLSERMSEFDLSKHSIISLCAGVSCEKIKELFPRSTYARVMPNSMDSSEGISAYSIFDKKDNSLERLIHDFFGEYGEIIELDEEMLSAFTAFYCGGVLPFIKVFSIMIDCGVYLGFSRENSEKFVKKNMNAATLMKKNPTQMISELCSPAGIGIEIIRGLSRSNLESVLYDSFVMGTEKDRAIGEKVSS